MTRFVAPRDQYGATKTKEELEFRKLSKAQPLTLKTLDFRKKGNFQDLQGFSAF